MTALGWHERPVVVQNLFNPAFCGLLLWQAVSGYNDTGMDYPMLSLVLPMILHRGLRQALPTTTRTTLPAWIQSYPEYALLLPSLVREVRQFTAEGLLWASSAEALVVSESSGRVRALRPAPTADRVHDDQIMEISHCVRRALFIGKWFAKAGTSATLFGLLGLRP